MNIFLSCHLQPPHPVLTPIIVQLSLGVDISLYKQKWNSTSLQEWDNILINNFIIVLIISIVISISFQISLLFCLLGMGMNWNTLDVRNKETCVIDAVFLLSWTWERWQPMISWPVCKWDTDLFNISFWFLFMFTSLWPFLLSLFWHILCVS